jgi:hypothetical protein
VAAALFPPELARLLKRGDREFREKLDWSNDSTNLSRVDAEVGGTGPAKSLFADDALVYGLKFPGLLRFASAVSGALNAFFATEKTTSRRFPR